MPVSDHGQDCGRWDTPVVNDAGSLKHDAVASQIRMPDPIRELLSSNPNRCGGIKVGSFRLTCRYSGKIMKHSAFSSPPMTNIHRQQSAVFRHMLSATRQHGTSPHRR